LIANYYVFRNNRHHNSQHKHTHNISGASTLEDLNFFIAKTASVLKHVQDKKRAAAILNCWYISWQSLKRNITHTSSNHGAFLHFNQLIGSTWSHVFTFHASIKHGLSMRGPDTDRVRKAHKYRDKPMDRTGLDAVFIAWSAHPTARPAGNAVEFYLEETPDETWESCLQEVLKNL